METRAEVEIAAPAAAIWQVLLDFPGYGEWNPFITHLASAASGEVSEGATLRVFVSLPEGRDHELESRVIRLEDSFELRWRAHFGFPGLFDSEYFFRLIELEPGRTRFMQGANFTGVLQRLAGRTIAQAERGFVYMNRALKKRVELSPLSVARG